MLLTCYIRYIQDKYKSMKTLEEITKLVEDNFEFKTEREAKQVEEIVKFIFKNL